MSEPGYPESAESLWRLIVGPSLWGGHFLFCYWLAAVYCAKLPSGSLNNVRLVIAVLTVLALAGIAAVGYAGYRRQGSGEASAYPPHREATSGDRHRFIGFATALLCGLSAVAVLYTALVALFFETCR